VVGIQINHLVIASQSRQRGPLPYEGNEPAYSAIDAYRSVGAGFELARLGSFRAP